MSTLIPAKGGRCPAPRASWSWLWPRGLHVASLPRFAAAVVEVAAPAVEPQQPVTGQAVRVTGFLGGPVARQLRLERRTTTGDWTSVGTGSTSDGYYDLTTTAPDVAGEFFYRVTASLDGLDTEQTGTSSIEVIPRALRVTLRKDGRAPHVSDDGRFVAYTRSEGVFVWDRKTGRSTKVRPAAGHYSVGAVAMTANGRLLLLESLTTKPRSVLTLWNPRTRTRAKVPVPRDIGSPQDISPDGRFISFSRRDLKANGTYANSTTAFLWDRAKAHRTVLARGDAWGYTSSVSRWGKLVVLTAYLTRETYAWVRETGRRTLVASGSTSRSSASPDGRYVVLSTSQSMNEVDEDDSGDVYLWDRTTGGATLLTDGLPGSYTAGSVAAGGRVATVYDPGSAGYAALFVWRRTEAGSRPVGQTWIGTPFNSVDALSASGDFLAFSPAPLGLAPLESRLVVQGPLDDQTVLH